VERLREVAVAGEAQFKCQHGQVRFAIGEVLEGEAQAQTVLLSMQAYASLAAEDSRKVERRAVNGSREFTKA
jgi:hypothetical protein